MDFVQLVRVLVEQGRNLVRRLAETCHANSLLVSFLLSVDCN